MSIDKKRMVRHAIPSFLDIANRRFQRLEFVHSVHLNIVKVN